MARAARRRIVKGGDHLVRTIPIPARNKPAREMRFGTSYRQSFRVLKKIPR